MITTDLDYFDESDGDKKPKYYLAWCARCQKDLSDKSLVALQDVQPSNLCRRTDEFIFETLGLVFCSYLCVHEWMKCRGYEMQQHDDSMHRLRHV